MILCITVGHVKPLFLYNIEHILVKPVQFFSGVQFIGSFLLSTKLLVTGTGKKEEKQKTNNDKNKHILRKTD